MFQNINKDHSFVTVARFYVTDACVSFIERKDLRSRNYQFMGAPSKTASGASIKQMRLFHPDICWFVGSFSIFVANFCARLGFRI